MTDQRLTPLAHRLIVAIDESGPFSVASFMGAALGDPQHGYYMTRDPFGARGDFITAPEVSQMFGEILGLWAASEWQAMGCPSDVTLIELGPGRGTLMADALRAVNVLPPFRDAITVRMVEMSPTLRSQQQTTLKDYPRAHWHESLSDALAAAGPSPIIVIANEFLDALPIHQLVMTPDGWRERLVTVENGALVWGASPDATALESLIPDPLRDAHGGALFEVCPSALALVDELADYINLHGGTSLFLDYGHERPGFGDTLQALKGHDFTDVLAEPGEADLTAHVDFSALARTAQRAGLQVAGPDQQGRFLLDLGIAVRAELLKKAAPQQAVDIATALNRLTSPEEMGTLFKVIALRHPDMPPSAGFTLPAPTS